MARRNSPVSIALASDAGRRALWVLGLIAVGKALGLVLVADGLSRGIVDLFGGVHDAGTVAAIAVAALGALVRAVCAWASSTTGARAAVRVREATREGLVARVLSGSGRDTGMSDGALTLLATRSLDDFDDYFTKVLPALTTTAAIPALLVARILFADWVSAVVLVLTLPLVPVFMILIGTYTADRVDHAQTALDRLSTHLVELARGLPVLVGLGRVRAQTAALRRVTRTYRDTTMQTLRVAFLSALALELLSTISVAVVAVFIGVRLVHGGMELQDGLFALVLAPECFLPLRRLGAAFHSTENGMRAFRRAKDVTDAPVAPPLVQNAGPSAPGFSFADLTVVYPGREGAAVEGFTGSTGPGLTVLRGASGAGKSTLLGVLTGLVRQENDQVVTGTVTGPTALAHAAQAPRTSEATIGEELALHVENAHVRAAALEAAGLDLPATTPCAELSPGELRRLALARAFGRVLAGTAEALLVDEPTAHLDAAAAAHVRASLVRLGERVPVLAATHDPALVAAADRLLTLGGSGAEAPRSGPGASVPEGSPASGTASPARAVSGVADRGTHDGTTPPSTRVLLGRLARAVDMRGVRFALAVLCGVCAVAAGASLTAVSAWLIVHASTQPPIMYLLVAIVGVRFFGLSRSVFTYAERLQLHHAMLDALVDLRERIWLAFARTGTANRALARGEVALSRLVSDVDDIRDLAPRVVLPPIVATVIAAAAVVVLGIIHPLAGLVMACEALVCGLLVPPLTLRLDARAGVARVRARRTVLERLSALLWAREDILVNGRAPAALAAFRSADRAVGAAELRAVRATGVGEALITAAGVLTGVCMLPVLAPAVISGALSGELLAVTVLLPLALIDPFLDALAATQQWPALRSVLARVPELDAQRDVHAWTDGVDGADGDAPAVHITGPVRTLALEDVAVRWPGMDHDVVSGVNAEVATGQWAVVSGPSGTGKTTLVSVLLGFLVPHRGAYRLDGHDMRGVDPADLEGVVAWCPQEAHVFDSSLRANLLIARGRDDAPSDEEMRAALVRVGLGDLVDEVGLGATIGAGGSHLSGGQRQRLAVARSLLARSSVVVLDEPTAHLDPEAARDLMADLRGGLGSQIAVLVTHDTGAAQSGDERIELGVSPVSRRT